MNSPEDESSENSWRLCGLYRNLKAYIIVFRRLLSDCLQSAKPQLQAQTYLKKQSERKIPCDVSLSAPLGFIPGAVICR
ncbi:hypothetical protein CEXT_544341 [Caerostris extrusa]|uniref:Uncharacterized protein n=1 Tax=Caerostris extrusa TaxID=172846 RepID=A0AAV4QC32_CAEEX|nr:hypothetical protein CEXT_544341 [Caerostris extrusa]